MKVKMFNKLSVRCQKQRAESGFLSPCWTGCVGVLRGPRVWTAMLLSLARVGRDPAGVGILGYGFQNISEVFEDAPYCGLCIHRSCLSQSSDWSGFGHSGDAIRLRSAGSMESTEEKLNCTVCSLALGWPCVMGGPTQLDSLPEHMNTSLGGGAGWASPAS